MHACCIDRKAMAKKQSGWAGRWVRRRGSETSRLRPQCSPGCVSPNFSVLLPHLSPSTIHSPSSCHLNPHLGNPMDHGKAQPPQPEVIMPTSGAAMCNLEARSHSPSSSSGPACGGPSSPSSSCSSSCKTRRRVSAQAPGLLFDTRPSDLPLEKPVCRSGSNS